MLYNPKWEQEDIYSIESFAAWLESKPKDETYLFGDARNCAAAQYLKAKGVKEYNLSVMELCALGWLKIVSEYPRTFGAAARHAASLLRS